MRRFVLGGSLLLLACRPGEPASATPGRVDAASTRARMKAQILGLIPVMATYRGLPGARPLVVDVTDDEEVLKRVVLASIESEGTPQQRELDRRIEVSLGHRPAGSDTADDLEGLPPSIGGLYDPGSDTLLVDSRGDGGSLEYTMAHEVVHYLQDASFDLERFYGAIGDDYDAALARALLVEGDAQAACYAWETRDRALASTSPATLRRQGAQTLDAVDAFEYPVIGCTQMLSYNYAASTMIATVQTHGWAAVDRAFREPPTTTEQLLHPEKLHSREPAVAISTRPEALTAALPDYAAARHNTLGEATVFCMLAAVVPSDVAGEAAAGWGGGRIVAFQAAGSPQAVPLVLGLLAWDSAADAAEFEPVFRRYLAHMVRGGYVVDRRGSDVVFATAVPPQATSRFAATIWTVLASGADPGQPRVP
jgi:hypothetical protein